MKRVHGGSDREGADCRDNACQNSGCRNNTGIPKVAPIPTCSIGATMSCLLLTHVQRRPKTVVALALASTGKSVRCRGQFPVGSEPHRSTKVSLPVVVCECSVLLLARAFYTCQCHWATPRTFTRATRHRIGISMFCSCTMDNSVVEFFEHTDPHCLLSDRFRYSSQPLWCGVVCSDCEWRTKQVISEIFHVKHDCQQLAPCDIIICFLPGKTSAGIGHDLLVAVDNLRQDSPNCRVECISVHEKLCVMCWHYQYWRSRQTAFKFIKGDLACIYP
jgi:hypothetical protein